MSPAMKLERCSVNVVVQSKVVMRITTKAFIAPRAVKGRVQVEEMWWDMESGGNGEK